MLAEDSHSWNCLQPKKSAWNFRIWVKFKCQSRRRIPKEEEEKKKIIIIIIIIKSNDRALLSAEPQAKSLQLY